MIFIKKEQQKSPRVTVWLPSGEACSFKEGEYETHDKKQQEWLKKLGYKEKKETKEISKVDRQSLEGKTKAEIMQMAATNDIDLSGAKTKKEMIDLYLKE